MSIGNSVVADIMTPNGKKIMALCHLDPTKKSIAGIEWADIYHPLKRKWLELDISDPEVYEFVLEKICEWNERYKNPSTKEYEEARKELFI